MLLSYIFGPSEVKYNILSNNMRSMLHAVIYCLFFQVSIHSHPQHPALQVTKNKFSALTKLVVNETVVSVFLSSDFELFLTLLEFHSNVTTLSLIEKQLNAIEA